MKFEPCNIKEIANAPAKRGSVRANLIAFLAMDTPCAKVTGYNSAKKPTSVLNQIAQRNALPVRAISRAGEIYVVNTGKAPEFKA